MSNKRITDLTELTNPTTDDVLPIVDIATNTTQKVQVGNLPTTTAVTNALATKQDTLVSGTNIKTLNSTSLLGSGNIVLTANPSGVSGAIQFSDGSAFASDASNLFWNNTTKRLGIGTNNPQDRCEVNGNIRVGASAFVYSSAGGGAVTSGMYFDSATPKVSVYTNSAERVIFGNSTVATIKGSGSTSATTSLLVQNSAGAASLTVRDNQTILTSGLGVGSGGNVGQVNFNLSADFTVSTPTNINFKNGYTDTSLFFMSALGDSIGIKNTSPHASAIFDIASTTKGFLPPRMTTTQKNAIASPAAGLVVYDSTTNKLCCYNGSTWNDLF